MMQHRAVQGVAIVITDKAIERRERAIDGFHARADRFARIVQAGESDPWFALRVMTGCEKAVENALTERAVEALVPMRKGKSWVRRGRMVEGHIMPVIHGYVLVRFSPDVYAFETVSTVDKVIGFLRAGEQPKRISHGEVKCFHHRAVEGRYDWQAASAIRLNAGDRVLMTDGPFAGLTAEVVTPNRKGQGDVVVIVSILGGDVPVTVPLAMVEKL